MTKQDVERLRDILHSVINELTVYDHSHMAAKIELDRAMTAWAEEYDGEIEE